ncbi:MAG TPA: hypothetical protein PLV68_17280, partial [Ilumatobacteraceae bacterium]|nr:hypothetical protein [Ilumatobacteraceae bacterium]
MARIDLDQLAELEEERRFLLTSLADLERERAAGDVDDTDYLVLHDGYTARAATVLRAIGEQHAALPPKRPHSLKRTLIGIGITMAVAGALVAAVLQFSAPRGDGDTITGNQTGDRVASLLTEAFSALSSDQQRAIDAYREVLEIEPSNVEAKTYLGWVLALASQNQGDATGGEQVLESALATIDDAIEIDPTYADPYCFRAIIAVRMQGDLAGGAGYEQQCLDHRPGADLRSLVDQEVTTPIKVAALV